MNQHTIIGNLARDPETGVTEGGSNWCTFTVAVNRRPRRGQAQEAEFIRVTAWGALGDSCAKYLAKGRKVAVTGESLAHGWTGQNGEARAQIELTARDVEFLGGRESGEKGPAEQGTPQRAEPENGMTAVNPEDQPF